MSEICLGAIWNFIKRQGSYDLDFKLRGTKGLSKAYVHRDREGLTHYLLILILTPRCSSTVPHFLFPWGGGLYPHIPMFVN